MGRRAQPRRWAGLAALAGCVAVLSACGGGSGGISAEEYATSVCSSVELWKEKLEGGSQVLAERLNTADTLAEVKAELLRFFDGAIRETDVMLAELGALEAPDVDNGEDSHAAVVDALGRFRPILVDARRKAGQLPLDDELAFTTGAQSIGAAYQAQADQLATLVSGAVDGEAAPELAEAVADDATCQSL
jgi:hypothetical protein